MPVTTVGRERRCSVDGARPHLVLVRRVPRASEGTSQAPLPRSQDNAADDRFPGPTHLRSVDRDPLPPRGRWNVSRAR